MVSRNRAIKLFLIPFGCLVSLQLIDSLLDQASAMTQLLFLRKPHSSLSTSVPYMCCISAGQ